MTDTTWVPDDVDTNVASVARVYDCLLGGGHHFQVDRDIASKLIEVFPDSALVVRRNREFLGRVVRWCVAQGVTQYLDVGCGLPTVGSVHEIVHARLPQAQVVYVDNEPVAVEHGKMILEGNPHAEVFRADLRDPYGILGHPSVQRMIETGDPIAVLMVAVLHFVEADADRIVATIRDALPCGSLVVISHGTADGDDRVYDAVRAYQAREKAYTRTYRDVGSLFAGMEMVEPGLVWVPEWHPDGLVDVAEGPKSRIYGGVGRVINTSPS